MNTVPIPAPELPEKPHEYAANITKAAREWLTEIGYKPVATLSDLEAICLTSYNFDGGLAGFVAADPELTAEYAFASLAFLHGDTRIRALWMCGGQE